MALQLELTSYLEDWIASGYLEDGSEQPGARNFSPKLISEPGDAGEVGLQPDSVPKALRSMSKLWNGPVKFYCERGGEGQFFIPAGSLGLPLGNLSVIVGERGGIAYFPAVNYTMDVEVLAAFFFADFYNSEWANKLMLCRNCKIFAAPTYAVRKSYVRGWLCHKCRKTVPATLCVSRDRKRFRDQWFALAVRACASWDANKFKADRVAWITKQVNEGLPLRSRGRIKRNRISRSMTEIEGEVERLKEARA